MLCLRVENRSLPQKSYRAGHLTKCLGTRWGVILEVFLHPRHYSARSNVFKVKVQCLWGISYFLGIYSPDPDVPLTSQSVLFNLYKLPTEVQTGSPVSIFDFFAISSHITLERDDRGT